MKQTWNQATVARTYTLTDNKCTLVVICTYWHTFYLKLVESRRMYEQLYEQTNLLSNDDKRLLNYSITLKGLSCV